MLHRRRCCMKWSSIVIAYVCIFLLSYQLGSSFRPSRRSAEVEPAEPRHLKIKRVFHDHGPYANSTVVRRMIDYEFSQSISWKKSRRASRSHGLAVFYDYTYHQTFFHQFLWLHASWSQLSSSSIVRNDLIVFISSKTIPDDFQKLINSTRRRTSNGNQLKIFHCPTLIDSLLNSDDPSIDDFSPSIQLELARVFFWQETRLSSLLIFLYASCREHLRHYDLIYRFDYDSFFLPNFAVYSQTSSSMVLGESIAHDLYTINRLDRIGSTFSSRTASTVSEKCLTTSWFAPLSVFPPLIRRILLVALWLIKEEFTESERVHHLTYFNYPSWYIDGVFAYASAIVLSRLRSSLNLVESSAQFDCQHTLRTCLHLSLRDPSHHLRFSKHSLRLLRQINRTNLTETELYVYRTVIRANGFSPPG